MGTQWAQPSFVIWVQFVIRQDFPLQSPGTALALWVVWHCHAPRTSVVKCCTILLHWCSRAAALTDPYTKPHTGHNTDCGRYLGFSPSWNWSPVPLWITLNVSKVIIKVRSAPAHSGQGGCCLSALPGWKDRSSSSLTTGNHWFLRPYVTQTSNLGVYYI